MSPQSLLRFSCLPALLLAGACTFGSLLTPRAAADTVTFWDDTTIENATVVKIEDGYIYIEAGEKKVRAKLANVKAVVKPVVNNVTRLYFESRTVDQRDGYVLGIGLTDPRPRIMDPLVRVFVIVTNARGEREERLYSSRRGQDPTSLADASMIDTESYGARYWFMPVTKPIAWHIDAWVDGNLAYSYDEIAPGITDVNANWWQMVPMRRSAILNETPRPRAAPKEAKEVAEQEAEALPKVAASITGAYVKNGMNDRSVTFFCGYALDSRYVEKAPLPAVTLYYVSEDVKGKRSVQSAAIEPKVGAEEKLQTFRLTRDLTFDLPNTITHGLGAGAANNLATMVDQTKVGDELIYWRVEVAYNGTVVAAKEGGTKRAQDTLPANWWK